MNKENKEVLIDIVAADARGDTWATLTSCVLARGLAPKHWRVMWHYTSKPLQAMSQESFEGAFAGHLLLPDVVVMYWPAVPNADLPVLKRVVEKLKPDFPLVIVTNTPKDRLVDAEIKDETGVTILEGPPDYRELHQAVKNLLEAKQAAAEVEVETRVQETTLATVSEDVERDERCRQSKRTLGE